jgi:ATP-dependent Zn protease
MVKQANPNMVLSSDKRFSDVIGVDESLEEVKEVVMYLKVQLQTAGVLQPLPLPR